MSDAYEQIMGGRKPAQSKPKSKPSGGSAYEQIMGGRSSSPAPQSNSSNNKFDSWNHWNNQRIGREQAGDFCHYRQTPEQIENEMNGTAAEIARHSPSRYFGDPNVSKNVSFMRNANQFFEDSYYNYSAKERFALDRFNAVINGYRPDSLNPTDIRRWSDSIGEPQDLREVVSKDNDTRLATWRFLSQIPLAVPGMLDVVGTFAATDFREWPQVGKGLVDGIVESVNVTDPNATFAQRFERTLNAAALLVGGGIGAGKLAGKGLKVRAGLEAGQIAKEFGISKAEGTALVEATHSALKTLAAEKHPMSAVAADVREVLFGSSSKELKTTLRERFLKAAEPFEAQARPGIASPEIRLPKFGDAEASGRIMPAPLVDDGPILTPKQINEQLFNDLSMTAARRGKTGRASEAGNYDANSATIITRGWDDLSVTPHEVAHFLDDNFNILKPFDQPRKKSPFDSELAQIWKGREEPKSWTLAQKRSERFAEFVRAWALNPDETRAIAPRMTAHFEQVVPAEIQAAMRKAGDSTRRLLSQDADVLVKSNINARTNPESFTDVAVDAVKGIVGDSIARVKSDRNAKIASKPFDTDAVTTINKALNDDKAAITDAANYTDAVYNRDRTDVLPENNPRILAEKLAYNEGVTSAFLEDGIRDINGELVLGSDGKPLNIASILEPLGGDTAMLEDVLALGVSERVVAESSAIKFQTLDEILALRQQAQEMRAAGDLAGATRVTKQANRVVKEARRQMSNMTGSGAGFFDSASIHAKAIELIEGRRSGLELDLMRTSLKRYREFSDALMQFAHDSGLISTEHLDNIRAKGDSYFDLGRVVEQRAKEMGLLDEYLEGKKTVAEGRSLKTALGRRKGATREIESPIVNLMFNVRSIVGMAEHNQLVRAIVEPLTGKDLTPSQRNLLASVGQKVRSGEGGKDVVTYLNRGKVERWQLHPAIAAALKSTNPMIGDTFISAFFRFFPRLLRDTVTIVPKFVTPNVVRDTQERWIKSDYGIRKTELKELYQGYRATRQEIAEYDVAGGGIRAHAEDSGSHASFVRLQKRALERANREGKKTLSIREAKNKYTDWRDRAERANRITEFWRAKEAKITELTERNKTLPPAERLSVEQINRNARIFAGQKARDLISFSRSGSLLRFVNTYLVPFTTAGWAGGRSSVNSFFKNPKGYLLRFAITQGSLVSAEAAWNASQGATEKWAEQPAYLKDFYSLFYISGLDSWIRIPKPHLEGVISAALPRAVARDFEGWGGSLLKAATPLAPDRAMTGPLGQVLGQSEANYDSFRGAPIVPRFEENLALELRDTSKASRAGQALQAITGQDARIMDFQLSGLLGNLGTTIKQLSDVNRPDKPTSPAAWLNITAGMGVDSADYGAKSVVAVGELARKSGAGNPLKPLLDAVRAAEKSQDVAQIKAAREQLYEVASRIRTSAEEAARGKKGIEKWRIVKGALGG